MKTTEYEKIFEAILFAAGESVSLGDLAKAVSLDPKTAKKLLRNLSDWYAAERRGVQLIEVNGAFQMCTNADYDQYIQAIYEAPRQKLLTPTLMETLAIIAYKQPITKSQIEEIRGVNADHAVNKLMEYGLISERGRLDAPGRPILFGTSDDFLRHFGFASLKELPALSQDFAALLQEAEEEINFL